jgi:hypothetical protein
MTEKGVAFVEALLRRQRPIDGWFCSDVRSHDGKSVEVVYVKSGTVGRDIVCGSFWVPMPRRLETSEDFKDFGRGVVLRYEAFANDCKHGDHTDAREAGW